MKAERRHELATNELAEWIVNFPKWLKENLRSVIIGTIVVLALIAYTIFYYSRENRIWNEKNAEITSVLDQLGYQKQTVVQGKNQGLGVSDTFENTASILKTKASETDNPFLSALALIKTAEAYRTELHYRPTAAAEDVRKYKLQEAMKLYEQALEKAKSDAQISSMAQYGIALCLEDMGNFEDAKKTYEKIVSEPAYKGTVYQNKAQIRINTMKDNQRQVVFAMSQKPQMPSTPEIQLPGKLSLEGPADVNKITVPKIEPNQPK